MVNQAERLNIKALAIDVPAPDSFGFTDIYKLNEELQTLKDNDIGEFLLACSIAACIKLAYPQKFESVKLPSVSWPDVNAALEKELSDNFDILGIDYAPKYLVALKILYGDETGNLNDSLADHVQAEIAGFKTENDRKRHMIWSIAGKAIWPDKFSTKEIDRQELLNTWIDSGKTRMDNTGDILFLLLYIKGILGEKINLGLTAVSIEKMIAERKEKDEGRSITNSNYYPFAAVVALDKADYVSIDPQGIHLADFDEDGKKTAMPEVRKF